MPARKKGERILGPHEHHGRWRVIVIAADGSKERLPFDSEAQALKYIELVTAEVASSDHTTESALTLYGEYLEKDKGNKPGSVYQTKWALKRFFPEPLPLKSLKPDTVKALYDALAEQIAVDTHRNTLAQVKTFLNWCKAQKLMGTNPAAEVQGKGRRKSGKPQLRAKQARVWMVKAFELAEQGQEGPAGALVTLLMGMRASEITAIRVRDLDEEEEPFDTLVIDEGKTDAAERRIEVPEPLRPVFAALAEGKGDDDFLFSSSRTATGRRGRAWPRKNVQRICAQVGLPPITAHGMRGALATLSMARGTAGSIVAQTLGHEDVRTTSKSYAKPGSLDAGSRKVGFEKLNRSRPKKTE